MINQCMQLKPAVINIIVSVFVSLVNTVAECNLKICLLSFMSFGGWIPAYKSKHIIHNVMYEG